LITGEQVLKKIKLPEEVYDQLDDILGYIEEGELEDAVDIVDALAEEFPGSYDVQLHRIHVYRSAGVFSDVVLPLIESCHATDPEDLEVWVMLIEELAELGFFGLAQKELELLQSSTVDIDETVFSPELTGSIDEAVQVEKSEFFGDNHASGTKYLLLNLAEKALYFHDFENARRYCNDLCKDAPDSIHSWILSARISFMAGDTDTAISSARKAIEISTAFGEPYYILTFAELLSGREPEKFPHLCDSLVDKGIGYQAYQLVLSGQTDALNILYDRYGDEIPGHPDAERFFECLAFAFYEKGDTSSANSLWHFATAIEPEGSFLADYHLKEGSGEDSEIPFLFFGPSCFPSFFSSAVEDAVTGNVSVPDVSFHPDEIRMLPYIFSLVLESGDATLVRITADLLVSCKDYPESSQECIVTSMRKFCESKRLSGSTRAYISRLLPAFGGTPPDSIYYKGRFVPFPHQRLAFDKINPCSEGSEEHLYFELILENENLPETPLSEIEEICKSLFSKTDGNPHIGVEYSRILVCLGKFDEAGEVVRHLHGRYPDILSVRLIFHEINLPQGLSDARQIVEECSESSLGAVEFRELKFLEAALLLLENQHEAALLELDSLDLLLPAFSSFTAARRDGIG
jgi:tetratricopeptide (TPR) repeat protein